MDNADTVGRVLLTPDQTGLTAPLTITFPEGWTGCGIAFKGQRNNFPAQMVGFWPIDRIYRDPCHWNQPAGDQPLGPSIEDAVVAMVAQGDSESVEIAVQPEDIEVDGFAGRHIEVTVPTDLAAMACDSADGPDFRFWQGPAGEWSIAATHAPGLIADVYFIDVEGDRVAIEVVHWPDAGSDVVTELAAIVESIDFRP